MLCNVIWAGECQLCQGCRFLGGPQVCGAFHSSDNEFCFAGWRGSRDESYELWSACSLLPGINKASLRYLHMSSQILLV